MAVSFDSFFQAIAGQESGGNYSARNGRTGALGKYQILASNIGPWSQKYLGKKISADDFMRVPSLQDQLARGVLQDYYNRYGARGAASAWYSGNPKKESQYKRFRSNEPSVGEYVDSVLKRAGQATGTASAGADQAAAALTVIDNTVQETTPEGLEQSTGDPYAGMNAAIAAGDTAAGIEQGNAAPTFDFASQASQSARATSEMATAQPAVTEGAYNQAYGIGSGDATGRRAAIAAAGKQFLGLMYKWGGADPRGFDCSGLIQYLYKQQGITLPRVSFQQATAGKRVGLGEVQTGDLVAWDNSSRNNGADHIALVMGKDAQGRTLVLEAPRSGVGIRIRAVGAKEGAWGVQMNI